MSYLTIPTQSPTPLSKYPVLQGHAFDVNVLKLAVVQVKQDVADPEQVKHV